MASKSTYHCDDLTEEIFGHLCNVALTKCSDKFERKKAGCGGRAMRKRVLIKNFVSDLFKMHKKPPGSPTTSDEQPMVEDDDDEEEEEYEDYEMSDESEAVGQGYQHHYHHHQHQESSSAPPSSSSYDEEMEDVHIEDLSHSSFSNGDCWLSQANMYRQEHASYYEYPSTSSYDVNSSGGGPSTYSMYDVYSNVSEQANEGQIPSPSDPLASISSIMQPSTEPVVYTDMYHHHHHHQHHHHQTNAEYFQTSEDYFMNAEYARPNEPQQEETHQLTDLDATTRESHPMKRRITESFEEFNSQYHQKRIKI